MRNPSDDTLDMVVPEVLREPRPRRPYLVVIAGPELGASREIAGRIVIGRGRDADLYVSAASVSRRHAEITVEPGGIWIADLQSNNGTFVNGRRVERARLEDGDRVQLGAASILRFEYLDTIDTEFHTRLAESAFRDAPTGLYNRRFLADRFPAEVAYALRHRTPLSLLVFDVDRFKTVNDEHGHPAGDAVLAAIARLAQRTVRAEDIVARYGGEEFVVLCRSTSAAGAIHLAERLRAGVEGLSIEHSGRVLRTSISVGVAACEAGASCDPSVLLAAADRALYRAKHGGRNRVELA